jgi:uncharacterized tellurite resistance protein B-like protein
MALRHLFSSSSGHTNEPSNDAETETVRRIVKALQDVDPARRRYLAGFAYVLARAANADLEITDDEARVMEHVVTEIGGVPEAHAVLVVEIARNQAELYSGTEDYLVTREFNATATDEERRALVAACFAVTASDDSINAEEYAELTQIAEELGLSRQDLNVIRGEYREQMVAVRELRRRLSEGQAGS